METTSNEIVWAKLKYEPFWPARLTNPPSELPKIPPRRFCVYFFGTNNYGYPLIENVKSYHQNRERYSARGRGEKFHLALRECEEFLKDPLNFCSMQPTELVVKEEREFWIKKENDVDAESTKKVFERHITCTECVEKDKRIALLQSQLREFQPNTEQNTLDDEYEVRSILEHRIVRRRYLFLVHWKGYPKNESTWVPKENLNCDSVLKKYMKAHNLN